MGVHICPLCLSETSDILCKLCGANYLWDKKYKIFRKKLNALGTKYKTQHLLYEICKSLYGTAFEEVAFPQCYSKKGALLRFDIYIPSKRVLIEYQGRCHDTYIKFFHKTKKEFKNAQLRDLRKKAFCSKFNYVFLEFTYKEKIGFAHEIKQQIEEAIQESHKTR